MSSPNSIINFCVNVPKNIENLHGVFWNLFQQKPVIVRSPGRINLIGEHTDYNDGFVLPAAIDKAAYVALCLRNDDEIHLHASDLNESYSIGPCDLHSTGGGWPNYILGVAAQFAKRGIPLRGFNMVLTSDIPIGAGLSSSAALECATVFGLNELFQTRLDKLTMIKMAQHAEHEFAGVRCGIMDQFASMMGKKDCVIKLDCRSLDYEYIPFLLEGYKVVMFNTNVKHSLAASEYNTRRLECELAAAWIRESNSHVTSLRDATLKMVDQCVKPRNRLVYQRAVFIVQEIDRLKAACAGLQQSDLGLLGRHMFSTHYGLSKMYEVSCREADWLVDQVSNQASVLGARMMGGGFGGCTINLVRETEIENLVATLSNAYEREMGFELSHYVVSAENGTELIEE